VSWAGHAEEGGEWPDAWLHLSLLTTDLRRQARAMLGLRGGVRVAGGVAKRVLARRCSRWLARRQALQRAAEASAAGVVLGRGSE
jgi:hypothetical protein